MEPRARSGAKTDIQEMTITHVDNNYRWNQCPLCRSDNVRKIGRTHQGGQVKFSSRDIELSSDPELWVCDQCASGFVQNTIPEAVAATLYSTSDAGERWSSMPFDQMKTTEVVHAMSVVFRDKGRVLDVGCNTGELLDFAKTFGCVTSGLEFSRPSREVILSKGHAPYQSFDEVSDTFEIITAFDVVEHLYDVPAFLNMCHGKLVDGGKLIVLTGDIQSPTARCTGARWWYAQPPEHIVFPSRKYFSGLRQFALAGWLPTYASKGYRLPPYRVWLSLLKRAITRQKYDGLPSWSPDHALICLTKTC